VSAASARGTVPAARTATAASGRKRAITMRRAVSTRFAAVNKPLGRAPEILFTTISGQGAATLPTPAPCGTKVLTSLVVPVSALLYEYGMLAVQLAG
jgi:hypothetical protein